MTRRLMRTQRMPLFPLLLTMTCRDPRKEDSEMNQARLNQEKMHPPRKEGPKMNQAGPLQKKVHPPKKEGLEMSQAGPNHQRMQPNRKTVMTSHPGTLKDG